MFYPENDDDDKLLKTKQWYILSNFCFTDKCNQCYNYIDKSDKLNCSCNESQFHCQCYKNNPVDCKVKNFNIFFRTKFTGCIPIKQ